MPRKNAQSESPPRTITLRVVYLREGDSWIAQCLEHDIAAQGKTLPDVEEAFRRTVVGQIMLDLRKGREPFEGIKPAPKMYWRKFDEGLRLGVDSRIDLPKDVPPAFMIQEIRNEARVA